MTAARVDAVDRGALAGIAAISATLLMTELALTRIFSVTMYYHFAFLAISIALFGLSASGVCVFVTRRRLASIPTRELLCLAALVHVLATLGALAFLVRVRVGLNYSPDNLVRMLAIYLTAALPFFTGGLVISLAFARFTERINVLYAADLLGAAAGCVALIPLLNWFGAPGVVLTAAILQISRRVFPMLTLDWRNLAATAFLLWLTATAAALIPARRALRISPSIATRGRSDIRGADPCPSNGQQRRR